MSTAVFRASMAVAIPVGSYGAAFGAASISAGLDLWQTIALSSLLFSGASQFALIGVIGSGGTALSAIVAGTLLGIRNGFYALRMAPLLELRGVKRLIAAHITIDEATAVALSQDQRDLDSVRKGFWFTGIGVYLFWNLFTILGALSASLLEDPARWGLDSAVPAAFLALLWPQLTSIRLRLIALIAMAMALLLSPLLAPGLPIISVVLIALIAGWRK
ncbi:MAG: AzlC family ABC transporter permease [Candidatus Nanopelagicaceae bacterium]